MNHPTTLPNLASQLLELARPSLTASQIQEVVENIDAGEPLLAAEFISDFLSENARPISPELLQRVEGTLRSMGSERGEVPHLRSLVAR